MSTASCRPRLGRPAYRSRPVRPRPGFRLTTPLFGDISDRIGRKRIYIIGALTMMAFAFPYYALLDMKVEILVFIAVVLSLPVHDMQYGP